MLSTCRQMGTVKFEHLDYPYLVKVFPLMAGLSAIGMLVLSPAQTAQAQQEELQQLDEFLTPADPPPRSCNSIPTICGASVPPSVSSCHTTSPPKYEQSQSQSPVPAPALLLSPSAPPGKSLCCHRTDRKIECGGQNYLQPPHRVGTRPRRGQLFSLNGLSGGKQSHAGTGIFPGSFYQTIRWQDLRATGII